MIISTYDQRALIIEFVSTLTGRKDNAHLVLGECLQQLEFDLGELSIIKTFKDSFPEAGYEEYYYWLHTLSKEDFSKIAPFL